MNIKLIAKNPIAYHNFNIEDKFEVGIVLTGTEIKSIRLGKVNLKDSYAGFKDGECYLYSMHISPYEHGNIFNKNPLRVGKGKKLYDKRQDIAKKDAERRMQKALRQKAKEYNKE